MKFFVSSNLLLLAWVLAFVDHGRARPQLQFQNYGDGMSYVLVRKQKQPQPTYLSQASMSVPSIALNQPFQQQNQQLPGTFYVLRKKSANNQPLNHLYNSNVYASSQQQIPDLSSSSSSYSIPILSSSESDNRRHINTFNTGSAGLTIPTSEASDWVSLETVANAFSANQRIGSEVPLTSGENLGSLQNGFRSNIPLPHNPFMPSNLALSRVDPNDQMDFYDEPAPLPEPLVPERGLQNLLNKYIEDLYKTKSPSEDNNAQISHSLYSFNNPSQSQQFAPTSDYNTQSRADVFYTPNQQQQTLIRNFNPTISHYTKPGSQSSFIGISTGNAAADYLHQAQSRQSVGHEDSPSTSKFTSIMSKLKRLNHLKEVFPPYGSYTPYGERTIVMIKYPGMPERKASEGLTVMNPFSLTGLLKPISTPKLSKPGSVNPSDFGVIVSQNHILQPESTMTSKYSTPTSADPPSPTGNLVAQLAKALAERNRIINTYSSSAAAKDKNVEGKPPFVLIHMESFTKKLNHDSSFGFDDEVEKNYSNGTIIYPTKNNPAILASTKFEFENIDDVEFLFDRPLEGYHKGEMKPIVPLGMTDIKNFLKLIYQVHTDIHEGGKGKVNELRGLSNNLERSPLADSRPLADWEQERSQGKFNRNWLHTSSIGLRSLSGDVSFSDIAAKPIVSVHYGS